MEGDPSIRDPERLMLRGDPESIEAVGRNAEGFQAHARNGRWSGVLKRWIPLGKLQRSVGGARSQF
jgi:hypothetical protein